MSLTLDPTVAGRYLADQLSVTERGAYEAHLMESPQAVAALEATARLKVGLMRLRETGDLDRLVQEPSSQRMGTVLALAASVAAVVIGMAVWRANPPAIRESPPWLVASAAALVDGARHPLPVVTTTALYRKRSSGSYDAVVELPAAPAGIELRVLPGFTEPSRHYGATLARVQDGGTMETQASVDNLSPAQDGFLTLYLDASRLSAGRYKLTLTGQQRGTHPSASNVFLINMVERPKY